MNHPDNPGSSGDLLHQPAAVNSSRRRLLRGGLAAAPVVLTAVSRPVVAGTCTAPSAFASLNASRTTSTKTCGGQKPSYWATCADSNYPTTYYPPTKRWVDCGLGTSPAFPNTTTLRNVCKFTETSGHKCVAAHIAAALLNAKTGIVPPDVLNEGQVKAVWNEFVANNFIVPTAGVKWWDVTPTVVVGSTPGGVVGYLRTTMI